MTGIVSLTLILTTSLWIRSHSINVHFSESPTFHQSSESTSPSSLLQQLSSTSLCNQELQKVVVGSNQKNDIVNIRSKRHRSNLMQTAVCFHLHNHLSEAMQLYTYLRNEFPNFAFPLVNIAFVELKNGKPQKAIESLNTYFEEVGGIHGNETKYENLKDIDAQHVGSACQRYAIHSLECVNALNFYGIAHVELYNYDKALESYERAIDIGKDDVPLVSDVYQNLGELYKLLGLFDDAAKTFLEAFWSSIKLKGIHKLDPTPLIQRAMLVPSIQLSLESSFEFVSKFQSRVHDLLKLIDHGGVDWANDNSELFMLASGVSQIEDIKSLPVSIRNSILSA